jgi:hypothetical protein
MAKKKTGKDNLGPEMAKKAYERALAGVPGNKSGPYDPIWNPKPTGPERAIPAWSDDKPFQVKVIKKKNTPKPGSTVIGPLAKGASSGIAGLALGAIAAYKAEIKATSKAKQKKNRMN